MTSIENKDIPDNLPEYTVNEKEHDDNKGDDDQCVVGSEISGGDVLISLHHTESIPQGTETAFEIDTCETEHIKETVDEEADDTKPDDGSDVTFDVTKDTSDQFESFGDPFAPPDWIETNDSEEDTETMRGVPPLSKEDDEFTAEESVHEDYPNITSLEKEDIPDGLPEYNVNEKDHEDNDDEHHTESIPRSTETALEIKTCETEHIKETFDEETDDTKESKHADGSFSAFIEQPEQEPGDITNDARNQLQSPNAPFAQTEWRNTQDSVDLTETMRGVPLSREDDEHATEELIHEDSTHAASLENEEIPDDLPEYHVNEKEHDDNTGDDEECVVGSEMSGGNALISLHHTESIPQGIETALEIDTCEAEHIKETVDEEADDTTETKPEDGSVSEFVEQLEQEPDADLCFVEDTIIEPSVEGSRDADIVSDTLDTECSEDSLEQTSTEVADLVDVTVAVTNDTGDAKESKNEDGSVSELIEQPKQESDIDFVSDTLDTECSEDSLEQTSTEATALVDVTVDVTNDTGDTKESKNEYGSVSELIEQPKQEPDVDLCFAEDTITEPSVEGSRDTDIVSDTLDTECSEDSLEQTTEATALVDLTVDDRSQFSGDPFTPTDWMKTQYSGEETETMRGVSTLSKEDNELTTEEIVHEDSTHISSLENEALPEDLLEYNVNEKVHDDDTGDAEQCVVGSEMDGGDVLISLYHTESTRQGTEIALEVETCEIEHINKTSDKETDETKESKSEDGSVSELIEQHVQEPDVDLCFSEDTKIEPSVESIRDTDIVTDTLDKWSEDSLEQKDTVWSEDSLEHPTEAIALVDVTVDVTNDARDPLQFSDDPFTPTDWMKTQGSEEETETMQSIPHLSNVDDEFTTKESAHEDSTHITSLANEDIPDDLPENNVNEKEHDDNTGDDEKYVVGSEISGGDVISLHHTDCTPQGTKTVLEIETCETEHIKETVEEDADDTKESKYENGSVSELIEQPVQEQDVDLCIEGDTLTEASAEGFDEASKDEGNTTDEVISEDADLINAMSSGEDQVQEQPKSNSDLLDETNFVDDPAEQNHHDFLEQGEEQSNQNNECEKFETESIGHKVGKENEEQVNETDYKDTNEIPDAEAEPEAEAKDILSFNDFEKEQVEEIISADKRELDESAHFVTGEGLVKSDVMNEENETEEELEEGKCSEPVIREGQNEYGIEGNTTDEVISEDAELINIMSSGEDQVQEQPKSNSDLIDEINFVDDPAEHNHYDFFEQEEEQNGQNNECEEFETESIGNKVGKENEEQVNETDYKDTNEIPDAEAEPEAEAKDILSFNDFEKEQVEEIISADKRELEERGPFVTGEGLEKSDVMNEENEMEEELEEGECSEPVIREGQNEYGIEGNTTDEVISEDAELINIMSSGEDQVQEQPKSNSDLIDEINFVDDPAEHNHHDFFEQEEEQNGQNNECEEFETSSIENEVGKENEEQVHETDYKDTNEIPDAEAEPEVEARDILSFNDFEKEQAEEIISIDENKENETEEELEEGECSEPVIREGQDEDGSVEEINKQPEICQLDGDQPTEEGVITEPLVDANDDPDTDVTNEDHTPEKSKQDSYDQTTQDPEFSDVNSHIPHKIDQLDASHASFTHKDSMDTQDQLDVETTDPAVLTLSQDESVASTEDHAQVYSPDKQSQLKQQENDDKNETNAPAESSDDKNQQHTKQEDAQNEANEEPGLWTRILAFVDSNKEQDKKEEIDTTNETKISEESPKNNNQERHEKADIKNEEKPEPDLWTRIRAFVDSDKEQSKKDETDATKETSPGESPENNNEEHSDHEDGQKGDKESPEQDKKQEFETTESPTNNNQEGNKEEIDTTNETKISEESPTNNNQERHEKADIQNEDNPEPDLWTRIRAFVDSDKEQSKKDETNSTKETSPEESPENNNEEHSDHEDGQKEDNEEPGLWTRILAFVDSNKEQSKKEENDTTNETNTEEELPENNKQEHITQEDAPSKENAEPDLWTRIRSFVDNDKEQDKAEENDSANETNTQDISPENNKQVHIEQEHIEQDHIEQEHVEPDLQKRDTVSCVIS
ncbi:uncharacterized protein [Amphiura filiformis]|uniref:uncharacterized protein n=1 Tax=Amphiura filiformis TaxID=82378 RepID=UPI003B2263A3